MSWPMVKLSEVATVNPRLPKDTDETQEVSFVAMASASEEGRLLSEEIRVLSETRKGFTFFEKSDVLLAKITPCFENGKSLRPNQIKHQIGFGSTEFHVLRADPDKLDSQYLFYMVWSDKFRWLGESSMSGAAGQKRVSVDFLKGFEIPLPPLAEQKRIAAILDKADNLRRKRQQAIQLANDFLRAVFLDMFGDPVTNPKGWDVIAVGDVSEVQGGLQIAKKRDGNPVQKPYLRVANVMRDSLKLDEIKMMRITHAEFERVRLLKDDILVVEGHGNIDEIGRCALWDGSIDEVIHQNHLIRIRVNDSGLTPQFVNDFINCKGGRVQMLGSSNTTSGLNTISTRIVKETKLLYPPIILQKSTRKLPEKCEEYLLNISAAHLLEKAPFIR